MANKVFNTRIQLKIDTHENWVSNNPVLLNGEAAICRVSIKQDGTVNAVPSTLIKIGDGRTAYNDLPFISALSANSYAWSLQPTKPTYTAQEISGIDDYISGKVQDTNTIYTINKITDYQYKLMSKNIGDADYTEVATIDIPKGGDSETVEQLVLDVKKLNGDSSTEGSVDYKIAQAVAAIMDNPDETMNSIKELVDWITNHAQDALELSNKVSALETKVGSESVQAQIDAAIEDLNLDDYVKDSELAAVAKSGLIDDLSLGEGTTLILNCGTSA